MIKIRAIFLFILFGKICTAQQTIVTPTFTIPDTVCVNTPVNINNTTVGATSYYWNFCVADLNKAPNAVNIGNIGGAFTGPVFMDYALDNGNYYGFVSNYNGGNLVRLDFGNSLLNTPSATSLGNFGGILPSGVGSEGIQIVQNEGKWYIIMVSGYTPSGSSPKVLKIEFGTSLSNPAPVATDWGNIGNLYQPIDLNVFKDGNNWYGFTANAENNTITRFDFTNSFNNTPTAVNLGNIGNLSYPTGIYPINDNGFWRVFVVNGGDRNITNGPYSLSRLDFGSSLLNTPTGVNLGNLGNKLQHPRDLTIMRSCGQTIGFIVNGHPSYNDIVKLDFNNDLTSTPSAVSLGNIGSFSFPHSISRLFRSGNDMYGFVTNVNNNTMTRLQFAGCTNSSTPSSSLQNPPSVTYSTPGTYNINLSVDDGLATQNAYCRQVVVKACRTCSNKEDFNYSIDLCNTLSVSFQSSATAYDSLRWIFDDGTVIKNNNSPTHLFSSAGNHTITMITDNGTCSDTATKVISITIANTDIILTKDTTVCPGKSITLNAKASLGFCWSPTKYLTNANSFNPTSTPQENITYYYTAQIQGNNLVVNGDFSQGNTGFTSEYSYATPNITEGQYFVGPNPNAWNPSMSACSGHTTGNDNMLLMNGSPVAGVNVWKQTIAVTPNTNYVFSTWIEALWPPNPAQLQFSFNGKPIGSLITASLPTCTWTQFYTTWNSGNNTSVVISIVNQNTAIQGNDFALDDISFAPVTIQRDSIVLKIDTPFIKTNNDTTVCAGNKVQLNTTGSQTVFNWSPSSGLSNPQIINPVATPLVSTQYIVTGINAFGCSAKDTVNITINPPPIIVKTPDSTICHDKTIQLNVSGGSTYAWTASPTLSSTFVANPVASPSGNTTYYVKVTDNNLCSNNDSIKITVTSKPVFAISADQSSCKGTPVQLLASGGDSYTWTPADGLDNASIANPSATPETSALYTVKINASACNDAATLSTNITVKPLPTITASSSNDVDCTKPSSQLKATGATAYIWQPASSVSDTAIASPYASPEVTTTYIVKGTAANGCSNYDSVKVLVTKTGDLIVNIPNAFSPNNDGYNDCFGINRYTGLLKNVDFSVYDRFGVRVFHTNDTRNCWDGRYKGAVQNTGGFVYILKASTFCGQIFKKGIVMLIK